MRPASGPRSGAPVAVLAAAWRDRAGSGVLIGARVAIQEATVATRQWARQWARQWVKLLGDPVACAVVVALEYWLMLP